MAILNPNFAQPGAEPGQAAYWTLKAYTSLESVAGFGTAPETGWEEFERWCAFLSDFDQVPAVRAFFYDATLGYESFNRGWRNEPYFRDFGEAQLEAARLGGLDTESFEANWSNSLFFDWSNVTAVSAIFDGEPFEDFEERWRSNETFARDWSKVSSAKAYFDAGVSPQETFEGGWTLATTQ